MVDSQIMPIAIQWISKFYSFSYSGQGNGDGLTWQRGDGDPTAIESNVNM